MLLVLASPVFKGLATIFYCLTFETSLFVASYDSQGHGGSIQSRLNTGKLLFWVLILQPMVSRSVRLGIKHQSGAYDQILNTVRQLRVCGCGTLSLTRGRVCPLQLLMALTSAVILGLAILLSQIRDIPFRRLLRPAGLRWRYSTPPPHGLSVYWVWVLFYDRLSAGQSVLNKSTLLGLTTRSLLLSDSCGFVFWGSLSNERTGL
jgi:hypothetical protein